jgi:hypothetical protein
MENSMLVELRGRQERSPSLHILKQGGHMLKILLTVAILGSVGSFAGPSMAQGNQGEAFGSEVSSKCAHRRVMPPGPRDDCVRKPHGDAQLGYAQGGAPWFSLPWIDSTNQQSDQRDEGQPKVRREQPKTSTSPKIATVPAPKAKKPNTPPRLDTQKVQHLYQEFLEWRKRQLFNEYMP